MTEGTFTLVGWRHLPVEPSDLGTIARDAMPEFQQLFVAGYDGMDMERRAFILRKRIEHEVPGIYFASLSSRTIVYKGMLTAPQVRAFFPDLAK